MNFTYTQAKNIINELGRFTIESYTHYDMSVIDTDNGKFAVGTNDDADYAWEESLSNYLEDVIYPELPESMVRYFDDECWKRDARYDGRGNSLSPYDGHELEIADLCLFRIN